MKSNEVKVDLSKRWNDVGTALVEFGLVIVVFFMFVFGVMDFGRAIYTYHFVSNAACEATRYAMVRGSNSTDPVTSADVESYVKSMAPLGVDPSKLIVSTSWTPNNGPGSSVRVLVSDNFQSMTPFFRTYHMTLSDSSQMVISQ
jgi:Flp pilus assembly protein TadG